MSFTKYLIAMSISPLYFALQKKWGAFIFNTILYVLAWLTILVGIGIIFWAIGVAHAVWDIRKYLIEEQAEVMAMKMAEKLQGNIEAGKGG